MAAALSSCDHAAQVCNHPDLFEGRSIVSSFDMWPLQLQYPSPVLAALSHNPWKHVSLGGCGLRFVPHPEELHCWEVASMQVSSNLLSCYAAAGTSLSAPHDQRLP